MTDWDRYETRELVVFCYGKAQAELAYQSMNSTIDRQEYARYHYHNAKNLFDAYVGKLHSPIDFMKSSFEGSEEQNRCIWEIGANVTACVQSLHAIADTFAYAMYHALGYKLKQSPLAERKINIYSVMRALQQTHEHQSLLQEMALLVTGDDYIYLDALSNHSKHRSLIRPGLWADLKGKKPDPYTLEFEEFSYDKKPYPRRSILLFLQSELDRQSLRIHEAGNVLNFVLKSESLRAQL
ncbi:MAG: hypothetical protein WC742_10350 [Gallionellaceae bacterium]